MQLPPTVNSTPSPWPHRAAVVLVCATFPLVWIGGLVTTYDAGMAVPDWPSTYGYNLFLYPWTTWITGPWDLMIEHGHRLLAAVVGLATLLLVAATWRCEHRVWVRWLTVVCLGLVVFQGVLGGLRVLLDATWLARVHGCVGPLYFVSTVVVAAVTSDWWRGGQSVDGGPSSSSLPRLVWMTAGIAYLQLILGAHLRHLSPMWPPGIFRGIVLAHLTVALVLAIHVALLWTRIVVNRPLRTCRLLHGPALLVGLLVVFQLFLGAATWRLKYQWPTWLPQPKSWRELMVSAEGMLQTVTVTAHVALGSLILALLVLVGLRSSRLLSRPPSLVPAAASGNLPRVAERPRRTEVLI